MSSVLRKRNIYLGCLFFALFVYSTHPRKTLCFDHRSNGKILCSKIYNKKKRNSSFLHCDFSYILNCHHNNRLCRLCIRIRMIVLSVERNALPQSIKQKLCLTKDTDPISHIFFVFVLLHGYKCDVKIIKKNRLFDTISFYI